MASAVCPDALYLPSRRQVCRLGRGMALRATVDARLCSRESMVRIVPGTEKFSDRLRLRSRLNQHLHALGELWWFHLSSASTTLASEAMNQYSRLELLMLLRTVSPAGTPRRDIATSLMRSLDWYRSEPCSGSNRTVALRFHL